MAIAMDRTSASVHGTFPAPRTRNRLKGKGDKPGNAGIYIDIDARIFCIYILYKIYIMFFIVHICYMLYYLSVCYIYLNYVSKFYVTYIYVFVYYILYMKLLIYILIYVLFISP